MKESSIAKVYAKAFLELADEKKANLVDDFIKLTEVINSSNQLENVLFLDAFSNEEKKDILYTILEQLKLSDLFKECLTFLIQEKRISLMPLIFKEIIIEDDERRGFIKGVIQGSAESINDEDKNKLIELVKNKIGKNPTFTYEQNKELSAGFKVTVEDFQIDASFDNQLKNLRTSITGN